MRHSPGPTVRFCGCHVSRKLHPQLAPCPEHAAAMHVPWRSFPAQRATEIPGAGLSLVASLIFPLLRSSVDACVSRSGTRGILQ